MSALRSVLEHNPQGGWEGMVANSFEQAGFLQQLDPSDVIIFGGTQTNGQASRAGLSFLGVRRTAPLLFVADVGPESVRNALVDGADAWLPRQTVLDCPSLLTAALERLTTVRAPQPTTAGPYTTERRQLSRLVSLLWETLPASDLAPWFSQRHMLDRLHEEIARCSRHDGLFSLILGEIQTGRQTPRPAPARWTAWAARLISRFKRRSDIVGQYGASGFLLLLPQTAEGSAAMVCRRLRALLLPPPEAAKKRSLRFRFGIASYRPADTAVALLCRAEVQLESNGMEEGVLA